MSHSELYLVPKEGEIQIAETFRNSWHGARYIWSTIINKHILPRNASKTSFESAIVADRAIKSGMLWRFVNNQSIPLYDRVTLAVTFDDVIVPIDSIEWLCNKLEAWDQAHGPHDFEPHARMWARYLRQFSGKNIEIASDGKSELVDAVGICFNHTSTNDDAWMVAEAENRRRYFDWSKDADTYRHSILSPAKFSDEVRIEDSRCALDCPFFFAIPRSKHNVLADTEITLTGFLRCDLFSELLDEMTTLEDASSRALRCVGCADLWEDEDVRLCD